MNMLRTNLFKKYYKSPYHDYEIADTLSYKDDTDRSLDIAFVFSGRNRGKSFEVSTQLLADAWYDKKLFGYVRRHDASTFDVEAYFADKEQFIRDMTSNARCGITKHHGRLKFYNVELDENGEPHKVIYEDAGYFFALSRQSSYKSLQYPDVYSILYEEVLTQDQYLNAEPEKLMNLYSTIRRNKKGFHMWLISNTVSAVNPYSKSWGLLLSNVKPGQVRLSKLFLGSYDADGNEQYLLIACHYLQDKADITKEESKKKRNRIKTGIASNRWDEATLYTSISINFMKQFQVLGTAIFEYDDMMIQCDIMEVPVNIQEVYVSSGEDDDFDELPKLSKDTMPILYIRRKTSEPHKDTRLYTNNNERFSAYSTRGFKRVYTIDNIIWNLFQRGWYIGADNLTLNDWMRIFDSLVSRV